MKQQTVIFLLALVSVFQIGQEGFSQKRRVRDYGIQPGVMTPGTYNAITDVPGVAVGHKTLIIGEQVRTGVTAILPHQGNIFINKVPAAVYVGNGFGKFAGITQIQELGNLETPIILTNTLSVPRASDALIDYTLSIPENSDVRSVNPVVGETNDGYLNDIRGRHVSTEDVLEAIHSAKNGAVEEGNVGAGTGTICYSYKGGIGTSSRKLPDDLGAYTIGVIVQTNFGGVLQIDGVPVGEELGRYYMSRVFSDVADGSCMIVVATDAPLESRNLERLAKRAMLGLAKTGGISSNGSGDYVIAFSTFEDNLIRYRSKERVKKIQTLQNNYMSPLFMAAIEATEEAILNSMFAATTVSGRDGHTVEALPVEKVLKIMKKHGRDGIK
ncbi:MAG: P1 family peptidase [Bacteroidota bacterium]|nr:P1 family peptidase [Bacteroidota bacterium]